MIYICLPVYNEEATVGVLLYKIMETMKPSKRQYTTIVLDDGSTDGSRDRINKYAQIMPMNLLFHPERKGMGPSLDRFIRETSRMSKYPERDIVITLDADYTQDPSVIPEMAKQISTGADIAIASRYARGSDNKSVPAMVTLSQRLIPLIVRPLHPIKGVRDYMSSFRAYRLVLLKRGMRKFGDRLVTSTGSAAATELLLNLGVFSPTIAEVPLIQRYDIRNRKSRNNPVSLVRQYMNMMSRLGARRIA